MIRDATVRYNYVVMLYKDGQIERCRSEFVKFRSSLAESINSRRSGDWEELRLKRDYLCLLAV